MFTLTPPSDVLFRFSTSHNCFQIERCSGVEASSDAEGEPFAVDGRRGDSNGNFGIFEALSGNSAPPLPVGLAFCLSRSTDELPRPLEFLPSPFMSILSSPGDLQTNSAYRLRLTRSGWRTEATGFSENFARECIVPILLRVSNSPS